MYRASGITVYTWDRVYARSWSSFVNEFDCFPFHWRILLQIDFTLAVRIKLKQQDITLTQDFNDFQENESFSHTIDNVHGVGYSRGTNDFSIYHPYSTIHFSAKKARFKESIREVRRTNRLVLSEKGKLFTTSTGMKEGLSLSAQINIHEFWPKSSFWARSKWVLYQNNLSSLFC